MKTILVVDDELANAEALAQILQDEGYRVLSASNGRHGLDLLDGQTAELVIVDLMMPLMNGAEMGRQLRARNGGSVKILMSTSIGEDVVHRLFPDYDAFLRKPYTLDEMLGTVRRLLAD